MKLDPLVARIVMTKNVNHFTTGNVRTAYLVVKNDPSIDINNARRFIYAELLKLVNKGWLKKVVSKKNDLTKFIKTEQLNLSELKNISEHKTIQKNEPKQSQKAALTKKLNLLRNELLVSMGEYEAYKEVAESAPCLLDDIEDNYNRIRDYNAKLLGKIKGVENVLNQLNKGSS